MRMTEPLALAPAEDDYEAGPRTPFRARAFLPRPRARGAARTPVDHRAPGAQRREPATGRFWACGRGAQGLVAALCQAWRDHVPGAGDYGYFRAPCRCGCASARWRRRRPVWRPGRGAWRWRGRALCSLSATSAFRRARGPGRDHRARLWRRRLRGSGHVPARPDAGGAGQGPGELRHRRAGQLPADRARCAGPAESRPWSAAWPWAGRTRRRA